ncbi:mitochondrial import receptor subunit TOM9-2 [Henckelia pumila]|uniref:mitochondrial import receptor subunit TOM9-2 n=1 Tax=Henckelia pumila TaxID=405737 RepID=UPI003C6E22A1
MASMVRSSGSKSSSDGVLSRISSSSVAKKGKAAASDVSYVAKRLLKSTGKAAWIVATTFIVLGLPLIIEMEREAQFNELELQQSSLLGAPPAPPAFAGPSK